jgi:hypothetical protein
MSTTLVRSRNAIFAFAIETTPGVPILGESLALGDLFTGDFEFEYDPQIIENTEFTGALDMSAPVVGALRPNIRIRMPLRGTGTVNGFDHSKMLACCAMAGTLNLSAVGVPTAATAGTVNTVTAAAPFTTTAQQYRGQVLNVTGGQTFSTAITNYTAGRVMTLGETRSVALSTSALLQIPANNVFVPTSDDANYKTGNIQFFKDGYRWTFAGAAGTFSIEMTTGEFAYVVFNFRAQFVSKTITAVPAQSLMGPAFGVRLVPPKWAGGLCKLNGVTARVSRLTLNQGVSMTLPDNPEAVDGVDPGVPISRSSGGTINPLLDTTGATALFDAFRAGTGMPLMAQIGSGSTVGSRFMISCPNVRATGLRYTPREGLEAQEITFQCDGPDAGLFLCYY